MRIRSKILLLALPLVISPLIVMTVAASLAARNGITALATEFLQFKAGELRKYAESQWSLLENGNLADDPDFVGIAKDAVRSYALSLVRGDSEVIFAIDESDSQVMSTADTFSFGPAGPPTAGEPDSGWISFTAGDGPRVGQYFRFAPFGWTVFVTDTRRAFYAAVNQIFLQSYIILAFASAVSVAFLIIFARFITGPLGGIVSAMKDIIARNDLSQRVPLTYRDEIGELGHTFNIMTEELQKAYDHVKNYAYQAAIAEQKEKKIRQIFQKYVPQNVIEEFYDHPESMLTGDSRVLAVLFSDIRDFTSISERMVPESIVESLNRYFGIMVERIMERGGVVDKYIGDAIMAFFGAPVRHENDALLAVEAGLDMIDGLTEFNRWQVSKGRNRFDIGIGINYGVVTVGNIGSDRKMDYTVIGETVNLASRLEGLTKKYLEPFVISESVHRKVSDRFPCRLLDVVRVKGMERGVKIYGVRRSVDDKTAKGWETYHTALDRYYDREFSEAFEILDNLADTLDGDPTVARFRLQAKRFMETPPPEGWTGVSIMESK